MKFYKNLYIGDNVNNAATLKAKLKIHALVNAYVIALAQGKDQLEIYHAGYLKQKYYRKHPPVIIGIAADYEEAVEIVKKITDECVRETGECDLKEYLKKKVKINHPESGD